MILSWCIDFFSFRRFIHFSTLFISFTYKEWIKIEIYSSLNRHFTPHLFYLYQSQDKMKCRFFLNIIIWQCLSFFELFSCKNQSLLIWWNSFFFLNHCFDCVNWIVWFNFECDCLTKICIFISLYSIWYFQFLIKKWTSSEIHSNHQDLFNSTEQKCEKNNYTLFHINFKN